MAVIPYARGAHLLGIPADDLPAWMQPRPWRKHPTATPTTLTGNPHALSSYDLTIAYRQDDAWMIYDDRNSQTTNRHVRAARAVIESQGYTRTEETVSLFAGWGRTHTYRRYRKEQ